MSDFLSQGGYGFYVWSAYAVSVLGVGYLIASTLAAWRKAKVALATLQVNIGDTPQADTWDYGVERNLEGISGWLIPPLIALVLNPFAYVYLSFSYIQAFIGNRTDVIPLVGGLLSFVLGVYTLYCLVRFLQKKRQVQVLMIILYVLMFVDALLEIVFTHSEIYQEQDFTRISVAAPVWILYFIRSSRVKNTFVR
jgi:heme exporter protein CcmD